MPVYEYYCDKCKRDVRVTLSSGKIKARLSNQSEFFDSWFPHRPAPTVRAPLPRDQLRLTLSVQIFSHRNNLTRADVPQNAL